MTIHYKKLIQIAFNRIPDPEMIEKCWLKDRQKAIRRVFAPRREFRVYYDLHYCFVVNKSRKKTHHEFLEGFMRALRRAVTGKKKEAKQQSGRLAENPVQEIISGDAKVAQDLLPPKENGLSDITFNQMYRVSKDFFRYFVNWIEKYTKARGTELNRKTRVTLREKVAYFLWAAGGYRQCVIISYFQRSNGTISRAITQIRSCLAAAKSIMMKYPPLEYQAEATQSKSGDNLPYESLKNAQLIIDNFHIKVSRYGLGYVSSNAESMYTSENARTSADDTGSLLSNRVAKRETRQETIRQRRRAKVADPSSTRHSPRAVESLFRTAEKHYCLKNGAISTNVLLIIDRNCRIVDIFPGSAGQTSDASTLAYIETQHSLCTKLNKGKWVLCDGGYGAREYLVCPFRQVEEGPDSERRKAYPDWPSLEEQKMMNKVQAATRDPIGKVVQYLKQKFQILNRGNDYSFFLQADWIISIAVTYNILKHFDRKFHRNEDVLSTSSDFATKSDIPDIPELTRERALRDEQVAADEQMRENRATQTVSDLDQEDESLYTDSNDRQGQ